MESGYYYHLKVVKFFDRGVYLLEEKTQEEVLLPARYVPPEVEIGSEVEVFVYTDSEDRLIATTLKPKALYGEIAPLEIVSLVPKGCYLDLGIAKDLFMPVQNPERFSVGARVVVFVDRDKSGRLLARLGVKNHLKPASSERFKAFGRVEILPFEKSSLGYGCVVDGRYFGLLFSNEISEAILLGEGREAYVKKIRPDGKIDLALRPAGHAGLTQECEKLKAALKKGGGYLALHYDSPPETIRALTGLSKKGFKRALGMLIAEKRVNFTAGKGIESL